MSNPVRPWIAFLAAAACSGAFARAQAPRHSARTGLAPRPPAIVAPAVGCGPTPISESTSNTIVAGNSIACATPSGHTDNSYWRAYTLTDFGISHDFSVCSVQIGVEDASSGSGTGQPITLNLYSSSQAFPTGFPGSLTLVGTTGSITVPDQSLTLLDVPVTGIVPAGSQLVVEVFTPDGQIDGNLFFIGSNAAAETAPSYWSAPACLHPAPIALAGAGFPNMRIVETVTGTETVSGYAPFSLAADPIIGPGTANGILEMNETGVIVAPGWSDGGTSNFTLTGTASNLSFGTLDVTTADYGLITVGAHANCLGPPVSCYAVTLTGVRTDHPVHFDVTFDETVVALPAAGPAAAPPSKTWTLHVGNSFTDVVPDVVTNPFYRPIETILHHGVTAGCGDGTTFCPQQNNLREEMAPFLLKAFLGAGYTPPGCVGTFQDVPCPATPAFPFSDFIEDLATRGITAGCQVGPPVLFCPDQLVTRAEMAPLLLKTLLGGSYTPPACASLFSDVPCPATPEFPFSDFVEDLANRGITAGCDAGPPARYCPADPVTREQMAALLTLTFGLVLYGP